MANLLEETNQTLESRHRSLTTFFLLHSDTNFGQAPDWDGSWDTYNPDYEVPPISEFEDRAHDFLLAMGFVFPRINDNMDDEEIMTEFYDAGKAYYGKSNLRTFFRDIYLVLTGRPDGARIGQLVSIWGCDQFRDRINSRLDNILEM